MKRIWILVQGPVRMRTTMEDSSCLVHHEMLTSTCQHMCTVTIANIDVRLSHWAVWVSIMVCSPLRVILTAAGAMGTNWLKWRRFRGQRTRIRLKLLLLLTSHLLSSLPVLLERLSLSSPSYSRSLSPCPLHLHGAVRESVVPKCYKGSPVRTSGSQRWQQNSKHTSCGWFGLCWHVPHVYSLTL